MAFEKELLSMESLRVSYLLKSGRRQVLDDVSFSIKENECLTILGESGSGKSTIAKTLIGLLPPSAKIENGFLNLHDHTRFDLSTGNRLIRTIRGRKIAMVFQDARLSLNPSMKIFAHFQETMLYHKLMDKERIYKAVSNILHQLDMADVSRVLESYPSQLSGGMCQRISIALAICLRPQILVADEPTSALDVVSQSETLELLGEVKKRFHLGLLFITHDLAVANKISDKIAILKDGRIVETGIAKCVLMEPKHDYTKSLIESRILIKHKETVSALSSGKEVPLISVRGLRKSFNGKTNVLFNINLDIDVGEIVGLLGKSGCGKSTLSRCILGLCDYEGGEIFYCGVNINGVNKREKAKHIQMVFQDARDSLNPRYGAIELVMEPLKYMKLAKGLRRDRAKRFLCMVGINADEQTYRPPQLSTGQCQRIAIARSLIVEPELLVCDEAVSALDMAIQKQILELLYSLQKKLHFTILMISHDIRVLANYCHKITVMENGEISDTLDQIRINEELRAVSFVRKYGDFLD